MSFDPYIDATGAARRLQCLAVAGYGVGQVAALLPARRKDVSGWRSRRHREIHVLNHRRIARVYELLWDTEGPSDLARRCARQNGWLPFEAWTDQTLDDPLAQPYSDPAIDDYVDWVLLDQVVRREAAFLDLTPAGRLKLFEQHLQRGGSIRGFRDRYRPVPVAILRQMQLVVTRQYQHEEAS